MSFRSIITQEEHNHHSGVSSQRNKMSIRTSIVRSISTYYEHPSASAGATKTKRRCRPRQGQRHRTTQEHSFPSGRSTTASLRIQHPGWSSILRIITQEQHHPGPGAGTASPRSILTQEQHQSRAHSSGASLLEPPAGARSIQHS